LIVILNEKLEEVLGDEITQISAFNAADNVLYNAVAGIAEIINVEGFVNVDFEDVKTVMSAQGKAMMGTATCEGENRAKEAAENAVQSPLLEGIDLRGARGILVNISASRSLKLSETKTAMESIRSFAAEDAKIIFGTVFDDNLGDELRVTVVATGLGRELRSIPVEKPEEINRTGTDGINQPFNLNSPEDLDVWNDPKSDADKRREAIKKINALEEEGVETFDIPAFLRKQAD